MDGGRSAYNSEIFCDLNQLSSDYNRSEVLSSVMLKATDEVTRDALLNRLEADRRLNVSVRTEREYYASQMTAARPLQILGTLIALSALTTSLRMPRVLGIVESFPTQMPS